LRPPAAAEVLRELIKSIAVPAAAEVRFELVDVNQQAVVDVASLAAGRGILGRRIRRSGASGRGLVGNADALGTAARTAAGGRQDAIAGTMAPTPATGNNPQELTKSLGGPV
jgi:hypothetical protein